MRRSFSVVLVALLLASCGGPTSQAIEVYTKYRESLRAGDVQGALKYWHPSIISLNEDLIGKSCIRATEEFGELLQNERVEFIGTKTLQTWVFSGIVFHDVVQLDVVIRMPKVEGLPQRLEALAAAGPLVVREFVHLVDFQGEMRIVNCEMRK